VRRRVPAIALTLAVLALTVISAWASSGGGRILFQSFGPGGGDTLYTMKQNGSDVRRLPLRVPGSAISPDWSPDGERITFAVQVGESQSIWIADADGTNARELFHCAGRCLGTDYPAWSPDGESIAFTYYNSKPPPTAGPPSADSIRVIDIESRRSRVVVRSKFPKLVDLARWSPNGRRLVVQRDRFSTDGRETGCRIEIVRIGDGQVRPLTPFGRFGFHPDWSSEGNVIAFDTYDLLAFGDSAPGASNLFTIRPDGTHLRQLTHFKGTGKRVSAATFTPDGNRVMFTYQVGGSRMAGIIANRGGAIKTVPTDYSGPVTHPRLSHGD
jgi:TolB protein